MLIGTPDLQLPAVLSTLDWIDGTWSAAPVKLDGWLCDPNTGEHRQQQFATAEQDVDRTVKAAWQEHRSDTWAWSSIEERVRLLTLIADGIDRISRDIGLVDAIATGNPARVANRMASSLGPRVRSAADQLQTVGVSSVLSAGDRDVRLLRQPLGPAVVLAPWNAPTFVAVAKVASALAAGCPVILKPSEWAPEGCQLIAEVIAAAVADFGLPPALFQLVHGAGAVGAQLTSDPRVRAISFTGGGQAGAAVAAAAAVHLTAVQLELGGHNPVVVMDDADLNDTARALASGMTKLNGQWCEAPGKVLVPQRLHDNLIDALRDAVGSLRVGHNMDPASDVGPVAYAQHRDRLQGQVAKLVAQGGRALTWSELPDLGGWFMAPTVIVDLDAEESQEEIFGPVITVHAVADLDAALRAADGPQTGLAGFVFGSDTVEAMQVAGKIPAGEVRVNGCNLHDLADGSEQTFWNSAGVGGHGPTDMVRFFQGNRVIGVDDPAFPI